MDSAPEGRLWAAFLTIAEFLDRVWEEDGFLVTIAAAVATLYLFMGNKTDLLLNASFLTYRNLAVVVSIIQTNANYLGGTISSILYVVICHFAVVALLAGKDAWQGPHHPYLIPCRTSHTRLFPKKHSFSYSYLTVGVPVGYKGTMNGLVKTDIRPSTSLTGWLLRPVFWRWFSVQASDHLQRGHDELDLRAKLNNYLKSEEIAAEDFPYAYLVTAPRFAGYNFNPVSFWFLYSKDKVLSGIVSEVNNTFDERRSYLLLRDFEAEKQQTSNSASPSRVKGSLEKDFHVSPFNSRKGTYSILANDPLGPEMQGFKGLDVTITLNSSKSHPKLVARLFSDGEAVDPMKLGLLQKYLFVAKWCWVGFATFPRIVKEAAALFRRRQLHVWYRPQPLSRTAGRHASSTEKTFEKCFRKYVEFCVSRSKSNISVKYISSSMDDSTEMYFTSPANDNDAQTKTLELCVLTPAFYTRFMHYSNDIAAFTAECNENRTIWINELELLHEIFHSEMGKPSHRLSFVDRLYLKAIQSLRQRPSNLPLSSTSADKTKRPRAKHTDNFRTSPMDLYVASCQDGSLKRAYFRDTLRRFVSKRYLAGKMFIIDATLFVIRSGIAWVFATAVFHIWSRASLAR